MSVGQTKRHSRIKYTDTQSKHRESQLEEGIQWATEINKEKFHNEKLIWKEETSWSVYKIVEELNFIGINKDNWSIKPKNIYTIKESND